jgi:hypothetical protein
MESCPSQCIVLFLSLRSSRLVFCVIGSLLFFLSFLGDTLFADVILVIVTTRGGGGDEDDEFNDNDSNEEYYNDRDDEDG